jgi:O-antigen/teichoic acid export membrane protein
MDLKQKVMSGLRWSAGLRMVAQLLTWAVTIIVIRLLSPGDYGLMAMAGVFMALLSMVSEVGLGSVIVQRKDLDLDSLQSIFGFVLVVSLFLCCLLLVGAPLISNYYNEPMLLPMLWVLSFIFLFSGPSVLPRALLLRKLHYKKIATIEFVGAIAGSVCTLVMALAGMGVWSLVGGYLAIRLVLVVCLYAAEPFPYFPKFKLRGMGAIFSFSGQVTISRMLWYFYASAAATLIIGKVLGKDLLGVYEVALYLACLPMEKVGGMINQIAFPAFSAIQDNPQLAGKHFLKAVRIISFIAIPIFWGISSIAPEIIGVFLGDEWIDAVVPLQIIAVVVPLRMVRNLMSSALTGLGRTDLDLKNEIVAVVLMPVAFFAATRWGVVGVSLVWLLVFPLVFVVNLECTRKILKFSYWAIYKEMWKTFLCGSIMYLSIIVLKNASAFDYSLTVKMFLYIAFGTFVFSALTHLLNRQVALEMIGLFKS